LSQVLVRKLYFVQDKIPMEINQQKVEKNDAQRAFKSRRGLKKVEFSTKMRAYFAPIRFLCCKKRYKPTHE
jgi:hypothetical protein